MAAVCHHGFVHPVHCGLKGVKGRLHSGMYLQYFGLKDDPFSVTPDPAFLFLGTPHREALGHLLYGAGEHGGFVQLSGEVGTGKTTLIRALLENRVPELDIALCWHPQLHVREFMATICDELGVAYDPNRDVSLKALVDRLHTHLLHNHAAGRRTLLIIDEAQNLDRDVLEQLRLLTNLETSKHKLLRIILVGQPEMDTFLARHDLRQLSQRISARFRLTALNRCETVDYINHRLACVGGSGRLFTAAARHAVFRYTRGTPRLINLVCERAMMGAYACGQSRIGWLTVCKAARETLPRRRGTERIARPLLLPAVAVVIVLLALIVAVMPATGVAPLLAWATASDSGIVSDAEAAPTDVAALRSGHTAMQQSGDDRATDTGSSDDTIPGLTASAIPAQVQDSGQHRLHITAEALLLSDFDGTQTQTAPLRLASASRSSTATKQTDETKGSDRKATIVLPQGPATPLPDGNAQLSQLLRLWGVFGAKVKSDCRNLRVGNLRCMDAHGTLKELADFNRPAILFLQQGGHTRRLLMSQLDDDSATLTGAEGTRRIGRDQLKQAWNGRFLMIWRADAQLTHIHANMIGQAVSWLRTRLARVSDQDSKPQVGPESPVFDASLEQQVRHFQLMHGLKPDGIVGPRTQIMLNSLNPPAGTPTLDAEPTETD